jgi:phosphoribosyl 1,2-cyclic phosphodiesterase
MLRFRNLGSGSTGNATVVEATGPTGVTRVLVDCGLQHRQLDQRLATAGLSGAVIDALFITHEHGDHIGCAQAFSRRHHIPVWMSHGTHSALGSPDFGTLLCRARDGVPIQLREMQLMPFTVPHDAREPLQLVCTDGQLRLGILTDLGHASSHVQQQLSGCHALVLECNHDPALLAASRYPEFLKQRIAGPLGHLSNLQAADLLRSLAHPGLRQVVAAHLSERNNRPELAQHALGQALGQSTAAIEVARPEHGTRWIEV